MRLSIALLCLLALLAGAPAVQAAGTYDPKMPPSTGPGPVLVSLTFHVLDFTRVNSRDESFELTGYLESRWHDPRLALSPGKSTPGQVRRLAASQVWVPKLYFANALDQPRDHGEPEVEVDAAGHVTMGEIISGKFSAELRLHPFPFDRQVLPIRIGAYFDRAEIKLHSGTGEVGLSKGAFLTDWEILGIDAGETEEQYVPGSESYSFVRIETTVERRPTFYLWRVLFPMTLLVLISWMVFWMDPAVVAPQATTAMGTLISLVAFDFAVDFAMPKIGYLTFIDRHALIGLAFVAAVVVEIVVAHHYLIGERPVVGRQIQRTARWLFPVGYLLAVAGETVALYLEIQPQ